MLKISKKMKRSLCSSILYKSSRQLTAVFLNKIDALDASMCQCVRPPKSSLTGSAPRGLQRSATASVLIRSFRLHDSLLSATSGGAGVATAEPGVSDGGSEPSFSGAGITETNNIIATPLSCSRRQYTTTDCNHQLLYPYFNEFVAHEPRQYETISR